MHSSATCSGTMRPSLDIFLFFIDAGAVFLSGAFRPCSSESLKCHCMSVSWLETVQCIPDCCSFDVNTSSRSEYSKAQKAERVSPMRVVFPEPLGPSCNSHRVLLSPCLIKAVQWAEAYARSGAKTRALKSVDSMHVDMMVRTLCSSVSQMMQQRCACDRHILAGTSVVCTTDEPTCCNLCESEA